MSTSSEQPVKADAGSSRSADAARHVKHFQWVRNLFARYATHTAPSNVSVHTWAYNNLGDPEASFFSVLLHLSCSLVVVVTQIVVLIAIINESTKVAPCEMQDDCSPGSFCMLQEIGKISENISEVPVPDAPIPLNFKRRCWDCVYMLAGTI